jgi:hypothetical protein
MVASNPDSGAACNISKMPPGFKVTQTGSAVKVSTDGCIPEPQGTPDYCPQLAKENGVSRKMTMTSSGKTFVSCVKNASPNALRTVDLDVCYSTGSNANKRVQGNISYEEVADCLTTDALMVKDLFTGESWVKVGGVFQNFGTLVPLGM